MKYCSVTNTAGADRKGVGGAELASRSGESPCGRQPIPSSMRPGLDPRLRLDERFTHIVITDHDLVLGTGQ